MTSYEIHTLMGFLFLMFLKLYSISLFVFSSQAKKAQHKSENQDDQVQQQAGEEDGVDISAGKYGNAKMNQSRDKPDIRLIENFAILTEKLDSQMVWVRARLHTSRAKGKFFILMLFNIQIWLRVCQFTFCRLGTYFPYRAIFTNFLVNCPFINRKWKRK